MHDDMARAPGLEKLRDALALALKEAEAAEAVARAKAPPKSKPQFTSARSLPRRF
jgi:hypothetical protein